MNTPTPWETVREIGALLFNLLPGIACMIILGIILGGDSNGSK